MGDMQITRWMQDRTLVTYWAKMLTFVGGMRFLWQSTLCVSGREENSMFGEGKNRSSARVKNTMM